MTSAARISYETFTKTAPAAYSALLALGKAVDDAGLEKALTELIKVRASQINDCAFCLQYHLNIARKLGVPAEKLDLVATWQEAGVYTDRELAALKWTEALCKMPLNGSPEDAVYEAVRTQFSETELVFLTVSVATINQWNRIAGALRFAPPIPVRTEAK
ncbi:MAG: carboxymuconolactone decarboxylase family protein [Burkholderiales bacterium]|nr:carboxymuconolactone decarboxylase family protein [Burkholderiales bacterium]